MRRFSGWMQKGTALILVYVLLLAGLRNSETDMCITDYAIDIDMENSVQGATVDEDMENVICDDENYSATVQMESTELNTASTIVVEKKAAPEIKIETRELEENIIVMDGTQEDADSQFLYEAYIEDLFWGDGMTSYGATMNSASGVLNEEELVLYRGLQEGIAEIANGDIASTEITVSDLSINLGTRNSTKATEQLSTLIREVLLCLLSDCPYELYWFDKTTGIACSYSWTTVSRYYVVTEMSIKFAVVSAYAEADTEYMTDTDKTGAASRAVVNAKNIVEENREGTDYEKLVAYKNAICDAVSYNNDVTAEGTEYGDPWQLIYVFDEDSTTNVVCEGYSKAFQYLCELSTFDADVSCYLVTGDMGNGSNYGAHMWNHVSVDGVNYMVDVTNSDSGTIGSNGSLFLTGMSGDIASGYTKMYTSKTIAFVYDSDSQMLYGTGEDSVLFLSSQSYAERNPLQRVTLKWDYTDVVWGYETAPSISADVLTISDVTNELSYQWYETSTIDGIEYETAISGATGKIYTIPQDLDAGEYAYRLGVSVGDCEKTADISISVRPLQVTAADIEFVDGIITKIYDGTTDCDATVRIKAGIVSEEAVEITGTALFNSADVATANRVTFTPDAITTGNYRLENSVVLQCEAYITKAENEVIPDAPQDVDKTDLSVSLEKKDGYEYSMDSVEWQDSSVFSDLIPNTTYAFYQRIKETDNYTASDCSAAAYITTLKKSLNAAIMVLELPEEGYIYDGQEKTPEVRVMLGNEVLDASQYEIEYKDNVQAGVASVTICASESGEYSGSVNEEFVIYPKPLTVDVTALDKVYDGTVDAQLTVSVETGVEEEILVIQGLKGIFEDDNAGTDKMVFVDEAEVVITGSEASNYSLTYPETVMANISKAPLAIVDMTVADKVYDGTADADVMEIAYSGLADGDVLDVGTDLIIENAAFTDLKAGSTIPVSVEYSFAQTEVLCNYEVSDGSFEAEADITPLTITPVIRGNHSKVYDGDMSCNGEGVELSLRGILEEDKVTAIADEYTYESAEVGENKLISALGIELQGADAGNYILSDTKASANIGCITKIPAHIEVAHDKTTYMVQYGEDAFNLTDICYVGDGTLNYLVLDSHYVDEDNQGNTILQECAKDEVVVVDETGCVTIMGSGTATIGITATAGKNYEAVDEEHAVYVSVTVAKMDTPPDKPAAVMSVGNSCTVVSDIVLMGEWKWTADTALLAFDVAQNSSVLAVAEYCGEDAKHYENTTVNVLITRVYMEEGSTEEITESGESERTEESSGSGEENQTEESTDSGEENRTEESTDSDEENRTEESTGSGEENRTEESTGSEEEKRTEEGTGSGEENRTDTPPEVNTILTEEKSQATYKVTTISGNSGTVEYIAPASKDSDAVIIPTTIVLNNVTYQVTAIAKDAFMNHKQLETVVIGNSIAQIGENAFLGCKKLKNIVLGKNITVIGDKAFYKCTSLKEITILSNITRIGKKAFYGCKKLKKITIKTKKLSKSKVGKQAFKGIHKKAVIKVPKKKLKVYKAMLKARGITSKVKVRS